MNNNINIEINDKFRPAMFSEKPYLVLIGSAGSGKSWATATKILLRTINEEYNRTLVVMKVGSKLRQYAFQTCMDVINYYNMNDLFEWSVAPLEIVCKANGNKVLFTGLDDPENVKSIPGIQNIWIEEATALLSKDFEQLNIRLRGESKTKYRQVILTFNPIDKNHWIYKDFFQEKKYKPVDIVHSTFRDNKFIGDDYEDRIRNSFKNDKNLLGVYLDGIWGERSEAQIYTNWTVDASIPTDFNAYKTVYCGIDFGFNDPNVLLGIGYKENTIYIFKELYFKKYTNRQFIDEIKKVVPRHIMCIADYHEPGNILEMKNAGIWVKPSDAKQNSINAGISFLKGMNIVIHPDCKNTIEEITSYSYLYNENMNTFFDKPTGGNDHCMDAIRYGADPVRLRKQITAGISVF